MDVKVQRSAARARTLTHLLSIDFLHCQKPLFVHFLFPMNISFEIHEFTQKIVSVLFYSWFIYLRGAPFANYKIHDNILNHQFDIVNYDCWNTVCKFLMACHSNHKGYKTYDGYYMSHLLLLGKFEYSGGPIFKVVLEC